MRESIGHYRILDRIGSGTIGTVYRARDTRAGRTVAIRVLSDEISRDPDRRRRFLDDARAAATVSHPNIAALFEVGDDPDLLYLVSEFVPGETLKTIIGGRPLNPRRAMDLAAQVADALAQAHAQGMVHGDLTPETIVVTPKGSAKIMEPGFAAWIGGASAPASAGGSDRSDIRSLGAVVFEMLTGEPPFGTLSSAESRRNSGGAVPKATTVNRALPPEVDPIVGRMLAEDAPDHFTSAAVLAAELRSLATLLAARNETSELPRPAATEARRSGVVWLVAMLVLAGLAILVWIAAQP